MYINVWKFFTYVIELERDLSSTYAKRLALLPSKSWFCTEGYGLLAPATGQQILGLFVRIVDLCHWPANFLFLLAGLICSGGMRQQLPLHTVLYRGDIGCSV